MYKITLYATFTAIREQHSVDFDNWIFTIVDTIELSILNFLSMEKMKSDQSGKKPILNRVPRLSPLVWAVLYTGSTRSRYCFNRRGSMEKINGLTSSINKLSHAIPYQILPRKSARPIISDGIRNFVRRSSNEFDKFVRREKKLHFSLLVFERIK